MKKTFFKIFKYGMILLVLLCVGIFVYIKTSPKPEIYSANNITLYDSTDTVFFQGNESKAWVSLDEISDNVIKSTIYTEDKNFYKHFGFDILRILKASYINITSGKTMQGASTITQQYAKNLFLDFDKTWKRKWDEMWYTMKIEANYSKDEILEGYLNTINYGHGMYGIENASKFYFNKSAKDLDLAEASILTGIPKSPANYSPIINFDLAKERQLNILELLVKNNVISEEEKNKAYNEELKFSGADEAEELTSVMYYQDAVLEELKNIDSIPLSYSDSKGLKIYTNLDLNAQRILEKNVKESIPDTSEIEASAVMMNPNTGAIIALLGGKNYNKSSYNRVISSKRQVGSTMKPYLYYAALENGFTSSSAFTSEKTTFTFSNQEPYSPSNYNNVYGNKPISMGTAIAYSENIYAVKTHLFLGEEALINVARRVGITSKLESVPSLPLGTNEISIVEMASGYSAFANLGYKVKGHLIEKVVDASGKVLYKANNKKELVLNSSLVFILNNLLTATYDKDYIDYNYPTAINLASKLTHKYGLKSGTTNTDTWYIGFNNDVVTAVWAGYDDNRNIDKSDYKYARDIWYKSIEAYELGKGEAWYEMPDNISVVLVDPISGKPATDSSPKKKMMYFVKGTEPSNTDQTFDEKNNNYTAS
ncbi:MAG: transglycosylase domain-containing protein [Bacilli bacterium]|nr:transglycosylase domain-containing protein [Mycoplasmatota bacterium]MDD6941778.1 transglycosylase domain-containing protein [bacterium]MEE0014282.1 transglycosylase domain-containing protein [Bacilli bacterium]